MLSLTLLVSIARLSAARPVALEVRNLPPTGENQFYTGNKAPLQPSELRKLPIGTIEAKGWLYKQLRLQADGWAGHLTDISHFLRKPNNAWLSSTGEGRNGWEEVPYWLRGYHELAVLLKDQRMLDESKIWIDATIGSQRENGYFGPQSNLTASNGHPDIWPNELMMCTLRSHYEATHDSRVIPLMTNYYHWQLSVPDKDLLKGYWEGVRVGDDIAPIVWLYNQTEDPKLLDLIKRVHGLGADWVGGVANWHGVNFAQGFREPAQYYQFSKDPADLTATEKDFDTMRTRYGQLPGGMYAADENARPGFTDPRQAAETCAMVEMMYSCEELLGITGEAKWGDRCEDVAFNSLPAAMTPDLKALHYLTSPNMVTIDSKNKAPDLDNAGPMLWFNPYEHRCCQHNTAFGWPYFAEHLWMASGGNGLTATLYAPNKVTAKVGSSTDVTIDEDTHYPFEETVRMKLSLSKPDSFPLSFRIPGWCKDARVEVNGKRLPASAATDSYVVVDRAWSNGDTVKLTFPQHLSIEKWPTQKNAVSVVMGPLTYSLKIGEKEVRDGGTDAWPAWDVLPTTAWNYGLLPDLSNLKVKRNPYPKSEQPFTPDASPIVIEAKARKIDGWQKDYLGLVGELQASPAATTDPVEKVELVPMSAARLRISVFPTVTKDGQGTAWTPPAKIDLIPATSSSVGWFNSTDALSDTYYPGNAPAKGGVPDFRWDNRLGVNQWVEYKFPEAKTVSHAEVYWVTGRGSAPQSWKLTYLDGDTWKDVQAKGDYPIVNNGFSIVDFAPVTANRFRIEAKLPTRGSSGIYEWRLR